MDATIEEIMKLVDSYKDAQASRRFGKLPLIRKAIEGKLSEALSKERQISQERKPLTLQELTDVVTAVDFQTWGWLERLARAIESAHGITQGKINDSQTNTRP